MGRPQDEFAWDQVVGSKEGWECKHCKKGFKGSASRIRNHLSGQGNDISACGVVPEQIRIEALNKVTRKRGRRLHSFSDDLASFVTRSREEYVTDPLIKFVMCINSSSGMKDVTNDPNFRNFLERVDKYGVPSSLLQGGSLVVEKSMLNIKEEVRQHMAIVTESWKTTGCTCILYYVNEEKQQNVIKCVYGFYCPKGFIFVEGPDPDIDYGGFKDALRLHSPRLDISDVTFVVYHKSNVDHDDLGKCGICEFSDGGQKLSEEIAGMYCLRERIQKICIRVCSRSQWAHDLITKAIQIHESCKEYREWYGELLTGNGMRVKFEETIEPTETSGLLNFLSIMMLEKEIKDQLSIAQILHESHVEEIHDDSKFWDDGRKLKRVLNLILKIPIVMDTLVPTAGYLGMAIDAVKETVEKDTLMWNFDSLFTDISLVRDLDSIFSEFFPSWKAARYLNPVYFLQHDQSNSDFHNKVCDALQDFYASSEQGKINEEVNLYRNVFSNLPANIDLKTYHPVTLWEKHGHELPFLRKLAIKLLSRPVTCMCNQVKKHIYELQGADDFILRLNVRMMEEFKLLGDDIYSPIDINQLLEL